MQQAVRGDNMITWSEQPPDFRTRPVTDLTERLSFTDACTILLSDQPVTIAIKESVSASVYDHLSESAVESGGLLLGEVFARRDAQGRLQLVAVVNEHVRADVFNGTSISLQMGAEVWEAARVKGNGAGSVIGWYHSHPNLGAFFSGTDRRTQAAFFRETHCLGLVIDPVRREECWFTGPDSVEADPGAISRISFPASSVVTNFIRP